VEATDFHIAGFSDETMIGTLVLSPQNKEIIRMRQVAVHSDYQKKGFWETTGRIFRKVCG